MDLLGSSKYKYLIVNLFFSHLGFWTRNFFMIVHFPDNCLLVPCLLVPFYIQKSEYKQKPTKCYNSICSFTWYSCWQVVGANKAAPW